MRGVLPALLALALQSAPALAQVASDSPLTRQAPTDLRVMTWNIGANSIFPRWVGDTRQQHERSAQGARILRAIAPDVICLNEVLPPRTPRDAGAHLDSILPLGGGRRWQVHGTFDNVIASRFPLRQRAGFLSDFGLVAGQRAHAMALVDLPGDSAAADLYVICAHMQSRAGEANIVARERHGDAVTRWIRDARTSGGEVTLRPGTAIVVLGDLNAYEDDEKRHVEAMLNGRLLRDGDGTAIAPDWDGSPLIDAAPLHNGRGPERYTYRSPNNPPGALDRILYTGSALEARARFVLFTPGLFTAERAATGLEADDGVLNAEAGHFDHLPVVVDFRIRMRADRDADALR